MSSKKEQKLKVCLDARIIHDWAGGVTQVVIGLANGLSQLSDSENEEYYFLCQPGSQEWLKPYLYGPCKLIIDSSSARIGSLNKILRRIPGARFMYRRLNNLLGSRLINVGISDGTIEKADMDLMHFTHQNGFLTSVPSIYQPHDLLHRHLPEFFTYRERLVREKIYRTLCRQAKMISVMTKWGKQDIVSSYEINEDRVSVIPWAPILTAYKRLSDNDLIQAKKKFDLPESFILYPAQTYPHKNHVGLLNALKLLQNKSDNIPNIVCCGKRNANYSKIKKEIKRLGVDQRIRFLGFVSSKEVQCLYKLCSALVFPSKFEGWGLPVSEAFQAGVPVACSNIESLKEVAGDAALLFDPEKPDQIADAMIRVWTDKKLRQFLIERGLLNISRLSWVKTARIFRSHYRRITNRHLTADDMRLLAESK